MVTIYLPLQKKLFETHEQVCERFGFKPTLKSAADLKLCLSDTIQAVWDEKLEWNLYAVAAGYSANIALIKPFGDANIRTAIAVAEAILHRNGVGVLNIEDDIARLMFKLEAHAASVDDLTDALRAGSYKLENEKSA